MGMGFARSDYLGGYSSERRRLVRLGHIACIALGFLQVLAALSLDQPGDVRLGRLITTCLLVGSFTMPVACLLCAWRGIHWPLFILPVTALSAGVSLIVVNQSLDDLAVIAAGPPSYYEKNVNRTAEARWQYCQPVGEAPNYSIRARRGDERIASGEITISSYGG